MNNKPFRIVPRIEPGGYPILFLPDLAANPGRIACYSRIGEHSESSRAFYLTCTKPAGQSERARMLAEWYMRNRCEPSENPQIRRRI